MIEAPNAFGYRQTFPMLEAMFSRKEGKDCKDDVIRR